MLREQGMTVDENERLKRIAALRRERRGYVQAGKDDRVKQVDEQLKYYGYKPQDARRTPPEDRSETPPRQTK